MGKKIFICILLIIFITFIYGQDHSVKLPSRQDTLRGSITPERSWWDVQYYSLTIKPDFTTKTLIAKNIIHYKILSSKHSAIMQIDLQEPLSIDSACVGGKKLSFKREGNAWFIKTHYQKAGTKSSIIIYYSGRPKESVQPPWDGGVVWAKDSLGRPWMSVACQLLGASIWYPCKDHQSDEPDKGTSITIIAPDTLMVISNGRLKNKKQSTVGTTSYTWQVVNPINTYAISFYIGQYVNLYKEYHGEKGKLDMNFWVLDYNIEKAKSHMMPEVDTTMHCLEHWFGPYPFYKDGFKIVDAPYLAMEHQTAIAYGNTYKKGTYKGNDNSGTGWGKKTDRLIVHEMAHEWFGNNITTKDIADMWVHEGFASYAEELAISCLWGKEAGTEFLIGRSKYIENKEPVIACYNINMEGSNDMNNKAWFLIHMIREIINNDDKFRQTLRGLNTTFHNQTITSKQIEDYISKSSVINFSKVFNQYLRSAQLPILEYKIQQNVLEYKFSNCSKNFSMFIKVNCDGEKWIKPTTEWQKLKNLINHTNTLTINKNFYLNTKNVSALL